MARIIRKMEKYYYNFCLEAFSFLKVYCSLFIVCHIRRIFTALIFLQDLINQPMLNIYSS